MILAQKLRLIWIDACLDQDLGLNRCDVMTAFNISMPQASHDFRAYINRWPDCIRYDKSRKSYFRRGADSAFGQDTKRAVLMALRAVQAVDI